MAQTLIGPSGVFANGERFVSRFHLTDRECWQWVAKDPDTGAILDVKECGWTWPSEGRYSYMPKTATGALWELREWIAYYLHPSRALKG